MPHAFTIGKLAKRADVTIDSIRFYERRGLIAEPTRTESNYRVYPLEAADMATEIKKKQVNQATLIISDKINPVFDFF